jgi:gelsolin
LTDLNSSDIFILDHTGDRDAPTAYAWIGKDASAEERRSGIQFAVKYLQSKGEIAAARITVVKMNEGRENEAFLRALGA